jgi:multicomponent Na+:H+ antiporter subunit D
MASPATTPVDLAAALVLAPPPLGDWLVILPVVLMIGAGAILLMVRKSVRVHGVIAIAALFLLVLVSAGLLLRVIENGPVTMVMGRWLPPFGIAFTADLFGAAMALTASLVALAAGIFALRDIDGSGRRYGFYPFLMLLMAGVSGAFLTGDIFNLYVWFEVLLISSFGLLILGSRPEQIDGALKYAVLNLIATTLFLISIAYVYSLFGTLNMADIALKAGGLQGSAPLVTLTALFTFAFAMKAAAFPLNFWLPASYHTPRIVVSALFGALLTKVGIYALIRITVMLLPIQREVLSPAISLVAILTLVTGAIGALAQSDTRRLAGYLVIAGIGNILAGVAIGSPAAISGAIFYALHSMVAMTALYLVVGEAARRCSARPTRDGAAEDHAADRWSLHTLAGIYRSSPGFTALSLVVFLAVAGLPPLSGLWPKIMLLKAAMDINAWWLGAGILVSAFLITLTLGRIVLLVYWRPRPEPAAGLAQQTAQASDWRLSVPLCALVLLLAGFGLFPERLLSLTQSAAEGLAGPSAYIRSVFPDALPSGGIR